MVSKIRKWGNSLALRIPKALAAEAGLDDNSLVEVKLVQGKLVISIPQEPEMSLADLLKRVTRDNLHEEVETGPGQGSEAW